ncbi:MAG: hypothetical protein WCH39_18105, partial [Schlesneria sp.]
GSNLAIPPHDFTHPEIPNNEPATARPSPQTGRRGEPYEIHSKMSKIKIAVVHHKMDVEAVCRKQARSRNRFFDLSPVE